VHREVIILNYNTLARVEQLSKRLNAINRVVQDIKMYKIADAGIIALAFLARITLARSLTFTTWFEKHKGINCILFTTNSTIAGSNFQCETMFNVIK
jgi:hypothetical protein